MRERKQDKEINRRKTKLNKRKERKKTIREYDGGEGKLVRNLKNI